MSRTLASLTQRPTAPRVVPRRRGETTPTIIPISTKVEPAVVTPVATVALPQKLPPAKVEIAAPTATPFEVAIEHDLQDAKVRRKYEKLADAIASGKRTRPSLSMTIFAAEASGHTANVVARLATVLADRDRGRILLVDGDASKRQLTWLFQRESKRGLAELLELEGESRDAVTATATPGLDVLCCGETLPGDKRSTRRALAATLAQLAGQYRCVLFSGGATTQPLAAALGQACDVSYLLVELGQTTSGAAREALGVLRAGGADVLGCVALERG